MIRYIAKSIFHNLGVIAVGLIMAFLFSQLDRYWVDQFHSPVAFLIGILLIILGFLLRTWATYYFYREQMKVVVLKAQSSLITEGPYRFSRNPLYLGGNVFIFYGAALIFGSPSAVVFTTLHLPLMDLMVRREEKQLEKSFGDAWLQYKKNVRRWI